MGTSIRTEISKSNDYYISKHRYLELQHFCLQYPEWKQNYADMATYIRPGSIIKLDSKNIYKPHIAYIRMEYLEKINLIEDIAKETDPILANYILTAITEGRSYTYLRQVLNIPCGKDYYYERYRKFFWILDKRH